MSDTNGWHEDFGDEPSCEERYSDWWLDDEYDEEDKKQRIIIFFGNNDPLSGLMD
jgi:hypothetical protein